MPYLLLVFRSHRSLESLKSDPRGLESVRVKTKATLTLALLLRSGQALRPALPTPKFTFPFLRPAPIRRCWPIAAHRGAATCLPADVSCRASRTSSCPTALQTAPGPALPFP